ncbi:MAG: ABC transporter permease [Candidatus Fimivivens sp.]
MLEKFKKHRFLFEELVKRDFKKKYKRTVLGMLWSIISPLLTLAVIAAVFSQFFGRTIEHFVIYVFCGNLIFSYFNDATNGGMRSLMANASIFTKVDVPKYMFLLSRNVQAFINFLLTLGIFFLFVAFEPGLPFRWSFFLLVYPIVCVTLFNIGVGMVLSALFVFFRDVEYLYSVFTLLLMYLSAIFYNVEAYALNVQYLFYTNPIYVYIRYFRKIVLENDIPTFGYHLLCAFFALVMLGIGGWMYKKYNHKFLYYI